MSAERRLDELGLVLPDPPPAGGSFVGTVEHNGLLFVSGHGPYKDGEYVYRGKVDSVVTVESAREAAELTMINALGTVRSAVGSLDRVDRVLKVFGMVNSDPTFAAQPGVIDAASDLLVSIFGERGRHTRSAVGFGALPNEISVEIEMVLALR